MCDTHYFVQTAAKQRKEIVALEARMEKVRSRLTFWDENFPKRLVSDASEDIWDDMRHNVLALTPYMRPDRRYATERIWEDYIEQQSSYLVGLILLVDFEDLHSN